MNIEQWPIFTTQNHGPGERVLVRQAVDENGQSYEQKVVIGLPGATLQLTATHGKLFAFLLYLWDRNGRSPDGRAVESLAEFVHFMQEMDPLQKAADGTSGGAYAKWLDRNLSEMLRIIMTYESAYKTKDGIRHKKISFTLIDEADVPDDQSKRRKTLDLCSIRIHPRITQSILEGNVKPVMPHVIASLEHEISVILYRELDRALHYAAEYECDVIELSRTLEFGAKRKDNLLAQLRKVCKELQGKHISTQGFLIEYCAIEKRPHKKSGWVFVARRGHREISKLPDPTLNQRKRRADELEAIREKEMQRIAAKQVYRLITRPALTMHEERAKYGQIEYVEKIQISTTTVLLLEYKSN